MWLTVLFICSMEEQYSICLWIQSNKKHHLYYDFNGKSCIVFHLNFVDHAIDPIESWSPPINRHCTCLSREQRQKLWGATTLIKHIQNSEGAQVPDNRSVPITVPKVLMSWRRQGCAVKCGYPCKNPHKWCTDDLLIWMLAVGARENASSGRSQTNGGCGAAAPGWVSPRQATSWQNCTGTTQRSR
jgi:hypothetical protein